MDLQEDVEQCGGLVEGIDEEGRGGEVPGIDWEFLFIYVYTIMGLWPDGVGGWSWNFSLEPRVIPCVAILVQGGTEIRVL